MAGLELKREMVAGDLPDPRRAALPVAAAVGGMAVPALIYFGEARHRCPILANPPQLCRPSTGVPHPVVVEDGLGPPETVALSMSLLAKDLLTAVRVVE